MENFVEHLREFHFCESTSVYWENSKFNFLFLELDLLLFVLMTVNKTLLGSDKNFYNCI